MRQMISKKSRQDIARALRLANMTTDESLRRELLDIAAELMIGDTHMEAPHPVATRASALRLVYDRDSPLRPLQPKLLPRGSKS